MFNGKPIIGIVGGIGSGKTYVARLFGDAGCLVIEADALVREAYRDPAVLRTLRDWWGGDVFQPEGAVDRAAIARRVFNNDVERRRLEALLHPWVHERRKSIMDAAPPEVVAFTWDTPLLFEAGLNRLCDAVVFVDAPEAERVARVAAQRGWDAAELKRREKLQLPLDKKREMSEYVVVNAAQADDARSQVRTILSRIVAGLPPRPTGA